MRLLVLAGGFGTRLKTAVSDVPKALAPVLGKPFLQFQLELWISQGIQNFTFLLHYQADQIIDFLEVQKVKNIDHCTFDWVVEGRPLDTGGAVANAIQHFEYEGEFLLVNADTWLGGGINEMSFSQSPSLAVVELDNIDRYGRVFIDNNSFITRFEEKSKTSKGGWINAGLSKLSADLFEGWGGCQFSIERELYHSLARKNALAAVKLYCGFIDIGIPEDYKRFCSWVKDGQIENL